MLHAQPHAPQIDAHDPTPVLFRTVCGQGQIAGNTGIIKRAVELAVGLDRFADEVFNLARLGHIGLNKYGLPTGILNQADGFLAALNAHVRHNNPGSTARKRERGGPPNA